MKKVIDVNIGRVNFMIEDEAYIKLKSYLSDFEASLSNKEEASEIMEDIEMRVAELFEREKKYPNQVVDMKSVNMVIECLGEIDKNTNTENSNTNNNIKDNNMRANKKLYRNPDDKKIAGVCGGIAAYFDIDPILMRIIFFMAIILGFGSALIAYIILWIVMPEAKTVGQKLEMYGRPVTADNIKNYTNNFTQK